MLDASTLIQCAASTQLKRNVAENAKRKHNPAESSGLLPAFRSTDIKLAGPLHSSRQERYGLAHRFYK
jgi:hypothetical protein